MLVTIQRIKSNTENLFKVISNDQLLFQAKAPWMKISLPFNAEDLRGLTFSNPAEEIAYTTRYRFIGSLMEELIPFKYLLIRGQRSEQFEIIGRNNSEGSFYVIQSGLLDSEFCIECIGNTYLGYNLGRGRNNYMSIYDDEEQITQIIKPLTVTDDLGIYFLHMKDEHTSIIPALSFFIVCYNYRKYNHSGEFTKDTVQISNNYTYDKNNDRYDPSWTAKEFGQQATDELEQKLRKIREQGSARVKKIVKLVGLAYLVLTLLAIVLFVVFKSILG